MAALFTIRNDGPDDLEVVLSKRTIVLPKGHQISCSTNKPVSFKAIPQLTMADIVREAGGDPEMAKAMAKQMGVAAERYQTAEDD
jgi:hypothetical protein